MNHYQQSWSDFLRRAKGVDIASDLFGELRKGFAGVLQFGDAYWLSDDDTESLAA